MSDVRPAHGVAVLPMPFDPEDALSAFRRGLGDAGAIVSFTGVVRAEKDVQALTLSHYPGYTEKQIAKIAARARRRFALIDALVMHRVGRMAPGEPIVLVAAAAAHRRAAFDAADYLMDYLKSAAPFWKQEETAETRRWIEPTKADLDDRRRWED